jgi:hypothetical protein
MARINLDQLDDFAPDFLETVQDGEIPVWNTAAEEFQPQPQAAEVIVFRRAFLLMGA